MQKPTATKTALPATEARILIVDSDEIFAKFFKIHLNKYFSNVSVTGDAREALNWFQSNPFDLVITDSNLPRVSSSNFVKRLRKLDENVAVIFMSDSKSSKDSRINEGENFLKKPFTIEEFHSCIKNGLHEKLSSSKFKKNACTEANCFFDENLHGVKKDKAS